MRRILLLLTAVFISLMSFAQEPQGMYVYRNNGAIDIFYTSAIDSIIYANYDNQGNIYTQMVSQVVRMPRAQTVIPLAEIDSVSFIHPDPQRMRREGKLNPITSQAFRSLVWDYKKHPSQLVFAGERPVVMDYWAPWCGYCIKMMPLVEQLAQEYKGKVDFYKVNTDDEVELSNVLGMTSLPCFYFYPKKGEPVVYMGMMDLSSMRKIIDDVLLVAQDEDENAEKPTLEVAFSKGDVDQEWTDRKVTALMTCTSRNATLVKYGCFSKEDFVNSGLSEREMVQNYGQVLSEEYLSQVNSASGMTLTFPVKKNKEYVFICMMKNEKGGVAVSSASIKTDKEFIPLLDFQAQRGALEDLMEPGQKYISLFMKGNSTVSVRYACLAASRYDEFLEAGDTKRSILEREGITLTAEQLKAVNGRGYSVVIGELLPETEYVCLAMATNDEGKVSVTSENVTTPFIGYDDRLFHPEVGLVTSLMDRSVSCSVNCSSGDAIYAAMLMLPSIEISRLMADGQTLEEIMETHPDVSVFADQQLEWINGQGISNVYPDIPPSSRYTWVVDMRGRFGGRTVKRSEVKTLATGETSVALQVQFNVSVSQGILSASATCSTGNASSAVAALMESSSLESLLSSGMSLEEVMDRSADKFLQRDVFSSQKLGWFNQNGFILGYSDYKKNTRYTWIIDVRGADGKRVVQRSEALTPKK